MAICTTGNHTSSRKISVMVDDNGEMAHVAVIGWRRHGSIRQRWIVREHSTGSVRVSRVGWWVAPASTGALLLMMFLSSELAAALPPPSSSSSPSKSWWWDESNEKSTSSPPPPRGRPPPRPPPPPPRPPPPSSFATSMQESTSESDPSHRPIDYRFPEMTMPLPSSMDDDVEEFGREPTWGGGLPEMMSGRQLPGEHLPASTKQQHQHQQQQYPAFQSQSSDFHSLGRPIGRRQRRGGLYASARNDPVTRFQSISQSRRFLLIMSAGIVSAGFCHLILPTSLSGRIHAVAGVGGILLAWLGKGKTSDYLRSWAFALLWMIQRSRWIRRQYPTVGHWKAMIGMASRLPYPSQLRADSTVPINLWTYRPEDADLEGNDETEQDAEIVEERDRNAPSSRNNRRISSSLSYGHPPFRMLYAFSAICLTGSCVGGMLLPFLPRWMGGLIGAGWMSYSVTRPTAYGDLIRVAAMRVVAAAVVFYRISQELKLGPQSVALATTLFDTILVMDRQHRIRDRLGSIIMIVYDQILRLIQQFQNQSQPQQQQQQKEPQSSRQRSSTFGNSSPQQSRRRRPIPAPTEDGYYPLRGDENDRIDQQAPPSSFSSAPPSRRR